MSTKTAHIEGVVKIGDGVATIRRKGISSSVVARILGRETSADGRFEILTLDRMIHRVGEDSIGDRDCPWMLHGAFVSVMTREQPLQG